MIDTGTFVQFESFGTVVTAIVGFATTVNGDTNEVYCVTAGGQAGAGLLP